MRILLVVFALVASAFPAAAQSDADRSAVQGVIQQQIQAFQRDDAATAYSFASPGIQDMYPTKEQFMGMVQQAFPQVYRPRSYTFQEIEQKPGRLEQTVEFVDRDGVFWTALYTLAQQPDGSWKITSCTILKKPGEVA